MISTKVGLYKIDLAMHTIFKEQLLVRATRILDGH